MPVSGVRQREIRGRESGEGELLEMHSMRVRVVESD